MTHQQKSEWEIKSRGETLIYVNGTIYSKAGAAKLIRAIEIVTQWLPDLEPNAATSQEPTP